MIALTSPPLRDRREDVPLLADHFVTVYCGRNGRALMVIEQPALDKLGADAIPLEGEGLEVRALARVLQVVGQTVPELPGTNKQLGLNRSASKLCRTIMYSGASHRTRKTWNPKLAASRNITVALGLHPLRSLRSVT